MNRIELNGVWYVKEDTTPKPLNVNNVTFYKSCVHETNEYFWEAILISKDEGKNFYDSLDIAFRNKETEVEEFWNNPVWLHSMLRGEPLEMLQAREDMSPGGIEEFRSFLKLLKEINWLT